MLVWPVLLAQVCTHYPTNFSFQNHFCNLIEILITKLLKIQYVLYTLDLKVPIHLH